MPTPPQGTPMLVRRTIVRCGEIIVTVEEPMPPRAGLETVVMGRAPESARAPEPLLPKAKAAPVPTAPAPAAAQPTSKHWEKSQSLAARLYWKEHLGPCPSAMDHRFDGQTRWERLVREWGLDRFRMAMDQVQEQAHERSPSAKYKLLRRIFRGWEHTAAQQLGRHPPHPGTPPEDSD